MVFFSERDLFSIDLFVADAKTGEVIRKITDTATSPHFESLAFLTSAGRVGSRDGKRFVFPGISEGEPVLTIVDVDRGRRSARSECRSVDEIVNPTWSPDGKQIAFSALIGGFNDLFVYDLDGERAEAADERCLREIDPAWSPDGSDDRVQHRSVHDEPRTIKTGDLRLATIDVASGAVRELGGFADAKNIKPQWARDGKSIFFLSDRQGISNIYRIEVDGGRRRR